jgi:hypothetical protein
MQPDVNAVDTVRFRSRLLSSLPATGLRASPGQGSRALAGLTPTDALPSQGPRAISSQGRRALVG